MSEYLNFSRFHNRLRLAGALVFETGVRVGAGAEDSVIGADLSVVRDVWGRPFIPGASLKGVLRAEVERLARTINRPPLVWTCPNPLDIQEGLCVKASRKEELIQEARKGRRDGQVDEGQFTQSIAAESCPVCRLFGSSWLAGKLRVQDLPIDEKTWIGRVEVRDGVSIRRDTRTAAGKRLYRFEAVPAGVHFTCQIHIENADQVELGLAMLGLRELLQGRLFLGGARSRGLGRAKLEKWETIEWVDGADFDSLLDYLTTGKGQLLTQADLDSYITNLVNQLRSQGKGGQNVSEGT